MKSRQRRTSEVLLFLCAASFVLGGCALFSNLPPIARLSVSPTRGVIPLDVQFDALASHDPDGRVTRCKWDFGDGDGGVGTTVNHRYTEPGAYLVRLSVRDNRGATSVATTSIDVAEFNELPTAQMTITPQTGDAPLFVVFDAVGSTDEDGEIEQWEWDFGDGENGFGSITTHRYMNPGTYTVRLTVSDDYLDVDTTSGEVVVSESSPIQRRFEWDYGGRHFDWSVSLPSALYYEYQQRIRGVWGQRDYDDYVLDPLDDEYLESLTNWIQTQVGTDYYDIVECAFNFVQAAIDYSYDPAWQEYPRYPIETLVDETGDCEDTAILYASLVRTLGAGAMIVAVDTDHDGTIDHMIALVPVSQAYADATVCDNGCINSFWTYGSQLYAFAETTGEPDLAGYYFTLGCDPWGLTAIDFKIAWDVSSITVGPKIERWVP
ncbi:PKD domain-containing protein [Candidatus Bipolaricaulota bacterium]